MYANSGGDNEAGFRSRLQLDTLRKPTPLDHAVVRSIPTLGLHINPCDLPGEGSRVCMYVCTRLGFVMSVTVPLHPETEGGIRTGLAVVGKRSSEGAGRSTPSPPILLTIGVGVFLFEVAGQQLPAPAYQEQHSDGLYVHTYSHAGPDL